MRYNTAIHINRRREHAMPRQARKLSEFGYMHLIIRGIGKQIMFEEEADYERFLSVLERVCGETEVRLCAYCLMENHETRGRFFCPTQSGRNTHDRSFCGQAKHKMAVSVYCGTRGRFSCLLSFPKSHEMTVT